MIVELGAYVVLHDTSQALWHAPGPGGTLCGLDGGAEVCYRGLVRERRCCGVCLRRLPALLEADPEEAEELPSRPRGRPPGKWGRLSDSQLRVLHGVYVAEGLSCRQLGEMVWERVGYGSARSAGEAVYDGFRRLGLPTRSQRDVTVARNWRHGRSVRALIEQGGAFGPDGYRRWLKERDGKLQPRCAGVRAWPPGRGKPCQRPAARGSDFCPSHDPARRERREAHMARMREEIGR